MVGDLARAFVGGAGMEASDRTGDATVESLPTRERNAPEERLTHELVYEGEGRLGAFGARHDQTHLLRLLDDVAELVDVDPVEEQLDELEAEAPADHRGGGQDVPLPLLQAVESPADDQADVLRDVRLVDGDVRTELPGRVEDPPVLDEVLVHFLDEERVPLRLIVEEVHQTVR